MYKKGGGKIMKDYIEQRAAELAQYIIDNNATVRSAAKVFNVSKSTVHTVVAKQKLFIWKRHKGAT